MQPHVVDQLLGEIVDSREKLDVLVYLHSTEGGPQVTSAIVAAVNHPCASVLDALSSLMNAGVVTTSDDGQVVWQLDPFSGWPPVIDTIAALYASDRINLLRRITMATLERLRAESGTELHNVIVLRPSS